MKKKALITGVSGQDGSYLAELLLQKDYEVYGLLRRTANKNTQRIEHLFNNKNFYIIYGDITDQTSVINALKVCNPHEVYNLAAQSFVGESWNQPLFTANSTAMGALNCLEAIRLVCPEAKFYQASSSEMYGKVQEVPQTEKTPFYPRSPYATAKCFAHYSTVNYRESYNMFCCSGILFNHESTRRGVEFVTRKITRSVASIYLGLSDKIELGNLDSKRDWGHAKDYVKAMWLMLQHNVPDDYVVCTGVTRSIRDLLTIAFNYVDIPNWDKYIKINKKYFRPAEVDILLGDNSKIKQTLNWEPEYTFEKMIEEMVRCDIEDLKNNA
ncbi:MAG: GDP-mannose 4,6-dehydratase [Bacillota bacterium]